MTGVGAVPSDDRGLTLGVGLFETILVEAGEPRFWFEHMARLARSCAALGLPAPDAAACRMGLDSALAAGGLTLDRAAVRLTWTGGSGGRGLAGPASPAPRLLMTVSAAPPPPKALRLVTSLIRRNATSPTSRHKTLSYLDNVMAREDALARGADEALMLNTAGELACAAAGNLFWWTQGRLYTPSLACGVLEGVMRAEVMARLPVIECAVPLAALEAAEAILITNSLIGVVRVASVDGRETPPLPEGLVRRLADAHSTPS